MSLITTTDPIYFNGSNLNSISGWFTTGTDTFRYPDRDVRNYHIATTNLNKTTSAFYTGRPINVRGIFRRLDRERLDESIGELRRILEPMNKTLQLPIAGNQRKFNEVTVKNIVIANVRGGYAEIDIEFATSDPHSYDTFSTTNLNVVTLTSGNKSYPVTFDGTAKQAPVIAFTLTSFTNGVYKSVTFSNPANNTSISVRRTWTAADYMLIDSLNKSLTINGVETEFDGNFLEWDVGAGFINYLDDFTARQVNISSTYVKRYL